MGAPPDTRVAPVAAERRETPRARLARVAAHAARGVPGVAGLDAGPGGRYRTSLGPDGVDGVVVLADERPDRYAVSLFVRAGFVDLLALAAEIRTTVASAVVAQGLGDHVGPVRVTVTDVVAGRDGGGAP